MKRLMKFLSILITVMLIMATLNMVSLSANPSEPIHEYSNPTPTHTPASILGRVSLPSGVTAPSGGINGIIFIEGTQEQYFQHSSFTILEGQNSANYSVPIPIGNPSSSYSVKYSLYDAYEGYIMYGYYSSTGTVTSRDSATFVNVLGSNVSGINLTILTPESPGLYTVLGRISMPSGITAPQGGIDGIIQIFGVTGGEDGVYSNFTIPEGENGIDYSIHVPINTWGMVRYVLNKVYDGYKQYGCYSSTGTTSNPFGDEIWSNATGIDFTILPQNLTPTPTVAPTQTPISTNTPTPTPTLTSTPTPSNILGDVNSDGKILSSDALMVLQFVSFKTTPTDSQKILADVTKDGKIISSDALKILQFVSGKIIEF